MKSSFTDDEKFLMAMAEKTAEGEGADPYQMGAMIGMSQRRVQAITVQLIRTNFIRRCDDDKIFITDHGRRLVERLRDE